MKTWGRRWRCWRWSVKHLFLSDPPSNPLAWQWKMWIWRGINSGGRREREKKWRKWDLGGRKENRHMHIDLITITWRRGADRACVTCVCMCMYLCISVYVCACACMCAYMCVYMCVCMCVHVCVYVCLCVHHACVCEVGRKVGEGERRLRGVCRHDRKLHHHLPGSKYCHL